MRAKFFLVIGIALLVGNSASEMKLVDGDCVLVGGCDADNSGGSSMTGDSHCRWRLLVGTHLMEVGM